MSAVSLSGLDYAGHAHGPNSGQARAMFLATDRALSRLLNGIAEQVPGGLDEVVIAVTGDHGVGPMPDYLDAHRVRARYIADAELEAAIASALTERFGAPTGGRWVAGIETMNVYLAPAALAGLADADEALVVAAEAVEGIDGVAHAITRTEVAGRQLPAGPLERQVLNGYRAGRSGDLVVVPEPFFVKDGDPANHHTGYSYDRLVPLFLAGPGIAGGRRVASPVEVIDLAPTLAWLAGVLPPATCEGRVLEDVLSAE